MLNWREGGKDGDCKPTFCFPDLGLVRDCFGPRNAREQMKCIVNNKLPQFFSHFPLTSLQNGRKPRADDKANYVRFIIWLSYSRGNCSTGFGNPWERQRTQMRIPIFHPYQNPFHYCGLNLHIGQFLKLVRMLLKI